MKKEILIEENGYIKFEVEFKESDYYASCEMEVYAITGWYADNHIPCDRELYLSAYVKWDGCSHFTFGPDRDGYMHLCGKECYEDLKKVIDAVWEAAAKKITNFNPEMI